LDPFSVGYSAGDWGPDNVLPALNDIAGLGFTGVEIGNDLVQIFDGREEEFTGLLKLVDLKTASVCAAFLLTEPRYLTVDLTLAKQAISFLSKVTKNGVLVAIPGDFDGDRMDGVFRAAWTLTKLAEETHAAGIRLCVKPHRGTVLTRFDEIARLLELTEGAADRVYLAIDTGQMTLSGTDVVECIRTWPERIGHVYLTDVAPRPPDTGTPLVEPGAGTADLPSAVYALRRAGYAGWVMGRVDIPPVTPRDSATAAAAYYRNKLNLSLRDVGAEA
jgi:sugar phosphate isomerase/epimerase